MATGTNVEQYIDINGLKQLLELIKQTYVCQKGLTSKVRDQIYDILDQLGSTTIVKQVFNDNRTDPDVIAQEKFPDYSWKNGDLLCVENTDGHMSIFYWNNSLWICISKAPVNDIDINDTEENLKKIIPTASAVSKIIDEKIDLAFGNFNPGTDGNFEIDIATEDKAGIVRASDEISVNPTSGLMAIKAIPVDKITGFDEKVDARIKQVTYTKEEINHLLLSSSSASNIASIDVLNVNTLYNPEYISKETGTIANITDGSGAVLETYILETTDSGEKVWVKLENHDVSITEKLAELEEKADTSGSWDTF